VQRAATLIRADAVEADPTTFPVRQVRLALRTAFGSAGAETTVADVATRGTKGGLPADLLASWAARVTAELQDSTAGEGLILGFPAAPFILAMHPDSMEDFESFIAEHGPDIPVVRPPGCARDLAVVRARAETPTCGRCETDVVTDDQPVLGGSAGPVPIRAVASASPASRGGRGAGSGRRGDRRGRHLVPATQSPGTASGAETSRAGVQATHFTVPPDLVAALRALGPGRGI
jgi:hypothetical protein